MAMISESDERRPTAMRMPNSSDIGTVSTTMWGIERMSRLRDGAERAATPDDQAGQVEELLHQDDGRVEEQAEGRSGRRSP